MIVENQSRMSGVTEAKRVLIIEDEPDACDAIRDFLNASGHHAVSAQSGEEAFRRAAKTRPQVVVCDWQLASGEDGADVARKLQRRYDVRIIFITAHRLSALRRVTQDLDVDVCLRKPISLKALTRAIDSVPGKKWPPAKH